MNDNIFKRDVVTSVGGTDTGFEMKTFIDGVLTRTAKYEHDHMKDAVIQYLRSQGYAVLAPGTYEELTTRLPEYATRWTECSYKPCSFPKRKEYRVNEA